MPRFMLDTDTCSYIMTRSHPLVLKRLQTFPVDDVCMSVVTKAELLYGVEVSPRRAQDAAALAAFLPYVEAVDLDEGTALHYTEIRAELSVARFPAQLASLWVCGRSRHAGGVFGGEGGSRSCRNRSPQRFRPDRSRQNPPEPLET